MEDIRSNRIENEEPVRDDERIAASTDEEVPFHIPRD